MIGVETVICDTTCTTIMAERATTAPPLTVENILAAVQGVTWRKLGERLFPVLCIRSDSGQLNEFYPELDEIEKQYQYDDERLHAMIEYWLQGDGKDKEPSWRSLIWSLDHVYETKVADNIRHFAEPPRDPTLTTENVINVVQDCRSWLALVVGYELDVPISQLCEMTWDFCALGEYFVQTDPHASWERLARELHRRGEEEAATAAKKFLPVDPTLTMKSVREVMAEVGNWEEVATFLKIPDFVREFVKDEASERVGGKREASEREEGCLMGEMWVNADPDASWELLSMALYHVKSEEKAAAMAKQHLPQGNPTLTTGNLMEVVKKVGHSWKNLGCKLGVRASKIEEIQDLYRSDYQRMEAIINEYVRHYPTPSWEKVATALWKMRLYKLADVVTTKYVKDAPSPGSHL